MMGHRQQGNQERKVRALQGEEPGLPRIYRLRQLKTFPVFFFVFFFFCLLFLLSRRTFVSLARVPIVPFSFLSFHSFTPSLHPLPFINIIFLFKKRRRNNEELQDSLEKPPSPLAPAGHLKGKRKSPNPTTWKTMRQSLPLLKKKEQKEISLKKIKRHFILVGPH